MILRKLIPRVMHAAAWSVNYVFQNRTGRCGTLLPADCSNAMPGVFRLIVTILNVQISQASNAGKSGVAGSPLLAEAQGIIADADVDAGEDAAAAAGGDDEDI